jgi:zinc resistance-associated protein
MRKVLFAGAFALAGLSFLSVHSAAVAADYGTASLEQEAAAVDITRIRHVLHLTPEQERLWPPVEAALRDIARRQAHAEPGGLVHRISHRVVSIVLNGSAIRRLAVAARPLIAVLHDDQKQNAVSLAQEMGLGPVLAALN